MEAKIVGSAMRQRIAGKKIKINKYSEISK